MAASLYCSSGTSLGGWRCLRQSTNAVSNDYSCIHQSHSKQDVWVSTTSLVNPLHYMTKKMDSTMDGGFRPEGSARNIRSHYLLASSSRGHPLPFSRGILQSFAPVLLVSARRERINDYIYAMRCTLLRNISGSRRNCLAMKIWSRTTTKIPIYW